MEGRAAATSTELSEQRAALLARLLADEGLDAVAPASIAPRGHAGPAPLSYAQEVLWLLDRASPGLTAYNTPIARRIVGPLDIDALARALGAVAARHDALRTVFATEGDQPVQLVRPPASIPLELVDLRERPPAERENVALQYLRAIADTPFDLTAEAPFRATLARLADDHAILLLLTHHIASDGWSYGVIFRDLRTAYMAAVQRRDATLPRMELQFADYATWQRSPARAGDFDRPLAYWRERLADLPVLELPATRPAAPVAGFAGARRSMTLPRALTDRVRHLASEHDVTLYMVLLAAYQSVFHRYTGQDDIVVGSAMAGRTRRETEAMVGYFSQALPMRTQLQGDPTFSELLARVADAVLGASEHQDVPFEALVLELQRARPGNAPLFRVVLTMQDAILTDLQFDGTVISPVELDPSTTKFDLTMLVSERADELELSLWYRTELFDAAAVDRFLGHFRQVLESASANPGQRIAAIPLLTAEEVSSLARWEAPEPARPGSRSLPAAIAARARAMPEAMAVVDGATTLTYGELVDRSQRLARRLRALGVHANTPVGLALERSADAMVGVLGIWYAGGAYVPLIPDLPPARLAQQVAESAIATVVTRAAHVGRLPEGLATVLLDRDGDADVDDALAAEPHPDDLAYILFTSGSTGVPKGVMVSHGNLAAYTAALSARLALTGMETNSAHGMHFATVSTLGADLGHTAVYPALAAGATLHILSGAVATDAARFADYLAQHPIDLLKITPSHWQALSAGHSGAALAKVLPRRWLVLGGEKCSWPLADALLTTDACRVFNHYGPTETTVGATTFEVTRDAAARAGESVPIGRPLPGVRTYLLDRNGARVPMGIPGELYIGGDTVTQGYVGQPERTAERFVADPFAGAGARMYRTGDRVRWLDGGVLEFLGRTDDQVKLRGYRVELGEIEQVLRRHPAVAHAVALLRHDEGGEPELVACVVPKATTGYAGAHAERLTDDVVTRIVREALPEYMVPGRVLILDELPLTPNGKVDRAALAMLEMAAPAAAGFVAPRTATEIAVAAIWCDVFKRDAIGVTEQFLQLGGHSLLAIRILGKLTRTFGVRLPLRALFDAPTVEQLAQVIDAQTTGAAKGPGA